VTSRTDSRRVGHIAWKYNVGWPSVSHMFTTWYPYPPPPPRSWNHGVGGNFLLRSLKRKELQVKSFRNKDLRDFLGSERRKSCHRILSIVKPACPIDTLGHENGWFRSDHSVVVKDRPRLRGHSWEIFSKQRTLRWFWGGPVFRDGHALRYPIRNPVLHLANGVSVTCVRNFGDEKWHYLPHVMGRGTDSILKSSRVNVSEWEVLKMKIRPQAKDANPKGKHE
jgi:hypothetical protein